MEEMLQSLCCGSRGIDVSKTAIQFSAAMITFVLLLTAALGYLVAPATMLSTVGISATPTSEFLVRTVAATFLAMLPLVWIVRRRDVSMLQRTILSSLAIYMFAGSAVDLHAYLSALVGSAAIPSIIFRCILGAVLAWLALSRD